MFERFKPVRKAEEVTHEIIVPLEGLEDKTYSLPDRNPDGTRSESHHDDWLITGEKATDSGSIALTLSRYGEDGGVETRENISADIFAAYQVEVDSERRVRDARMDPAIDIGASAVRMSIVNMVREIRNDPTNEKYAGLEEIEKRITKEFRESSDARRSESLHLTQEHREKQRRENPLKKLQRGDHRKNRAEE